MADALGWMTFHAGRAGNCDRNIAETILMDAAEFVGTTIDMARVDTWRQVDLDTVEFQTWSDNGDEVVWRITYDSDVDGSRVDLQPRHRRRPVAPSHPPHGGAVRPPRVNA